MAWCSLGPWLDLSLARLGALVSRGSLMDIGAIQRAGSLVLDGALCASGSLYAYLEKCKTVFCFNNAVYRSAFNRRLRSRLSGEECWRDNGTAKKSHGRGTASVSEVTLFRRLPNALPVWDIIITAPALGCYR